MQRKIPLQPIGIALALVLAAVGPAAGGVISDVGAIPSPFSPNGDGVLDSTAVHYTLSEATAVFIEILDAAQAEPVGLWWGSEEAGSHAHWWDGDLAPLEPAVTDPAPDGDYYFRITADFGNPGSPEVAIHPFTIDTEAPTLTEFDVSPTRFSPDGDGVGDSLCVATGVEYSDSSDLVVLRILDTDDEPVRTLYNGSAAGSVYVCWDGMGDGGGQMDDGLYYVSVETRDSAGNTDSAGSLVDIDTSPPMLSVSYPDSAMEEWRVDATAADLEGWAYDRAGVVAVEMSVDGGEWLVLADVRSDTAEWHAALSCGSCVAGEVDETVEVSVRARDGVPTADGMGHVNTSSTTPAAASFDVVFDVAPPLHSSTELEEGVADYRRGETITIVTEWDAPDYEILADFSQVDSTFDADDVEVTVSSTGRYTIAYQISDASTLVPVTNAPISISATDYFGRMASGTTVYVNVHSGGVGAAGLSVDVNSFNPAVGGDVTVDFGSYAGPATVRVYNMVGTLVRTIEVDHASSVAWNGGSDGGDMVASGVYILRIQTDAGEAVRKVAVVK